MNLTIPSPLVMELFNLVGALVLLGVALLLVTLVVFAIVEHVQHRRVEARQRRFQAEQARIQADADQVGRHLAEQAFRVQREMLRRATDSQRPEFWGWDGHHG